MERTRDRERSELTAPSRDDLIERAQKAWPTCWWYIGLHYPECNASRPCDFLKHRDADSFRCLLEDMRELAGVWRAGALRLENAAGEMEMLELERESARR